MELCTSMPVCLPHIAKASSSLQPSSGSCKTTQVCLPHHLSSRIRLRALCLLHHHHLSSPVPLLIRLRRSTFPPSFQTHSSPRHALNSAAAFADQIQNIILACLCAICASFLRAVFHCSRRVAASTRKAPLS